MGAHSASGGRRRSGVHVEGPAAETPGTGRRRRHAAPASAVQPPVESPVEAALEVPLVTGTLAATVESLAADAVAAENRIIDALLAVDPEWDEPAADARIPAAPTPDEPAARVADPAPVLDEVIDPAAWVLDPAPVLDEVIDPAAWVLDPAPVLDEVIDPAAWVLDPAPVLDEVIDLPPRVRRRRKQVQSVARALRWTLVGTLLPGVAHLAAGRRRIGMVMAGSFATLLVASIVLLTAVPHTRLLELSVKADELEAVMALSIALGLIWVLVVISSWAVHKPDQMHSGQRAFAAGVVATLSIGVAAPFAVGARTAYVQLDLLHTIFDNPEAAGTVAMSALPGKPQPAGFGPATGFFADKPRVNVLLLGGDGGTNRQGIRTDTMILASIDTRTGRTVLTSLPRNLMKVQFPAGSEMARRFPNGFNDMLNAVYMYGADDRSVMPGAKYPGGELIKQTFAWSIAQPVDYFVLVNLDGFRDIVDAFGGVTLTVERRLPIGGSHDANGNVQEQPHAYLEPGRRKLNGYEALWYGRSRFDSDDYSRMNRQRCVLGAIARQASPINVLTNFSQLAGAAKRIIITDIPRAALPDLLLLANKAKKAQVSSVTFVRSASFDPANPDFAYMQEQVRLAIEEAARPGDSATPTPTPTPTVTPGGKKGTQAGAKKATKATVATKPAPPVADSLDSVCDY